MGKDNKSETADFRQSAGKLIKSGTSKLVSLLTDGEMLKLIHELEVHQVELETQNEELISVFSEHKRVEELLKASERRYRQLFESAKDGILILDAETGKIADVNPFMIEMLGYSKPQFLDKAIWEIGFLKDLFANQDKFLELQQKEYVRYDDLPLETADGRKISVEFVSNSYFEGNEKVIQCNIREITESKKIHNEIKLQANLLSHVGQAVIATDLSGNVIYWNNAAEEIYGWSSVEAIGQNIVSLTPTQTTTKQATEILNELSGGNTWSGEFLVKRKDGSFFPALVTDAPFYNHKGEIEGIIGISSDITDRKHLEKELVEAKERAEESDRLKSAFLANMSHEIRTPLNSIIGFSELLGDADFSESQKIKFIQLIISNGNNLLNIISDILDISKIESGEINIRKSKIQVNKLFYEIFAMHVLSVEEKKLKFTTSCAVFDVKGEIFVLADKERLMQIFNNLISNALKFTSVGYIEIGCRLADKMILFHVKDTGIGIPDGYHTKIFERFRQVEATYTRKYGGNGLGLAISKNLVELMGGKIWVESEVGKGSAFYFSLPCVK